MKKLLAFLLVLVMILSVSLVACKKKAEEPAEDDDDGWGNGGGTTTESIADNNDKDDDNGENIETPTGVTFTDCEDFTVYIAHDVTLRTTYSDAASAKTDIVLPMGASVTVTETSNSKWYKVKHTDAQDYYIYSYVTVSDVKSVTFDDIEPTPSSLINERTDGTEDGFNLRATPCIKSQYKEDINALNLNNEAGFSGVKKSETSNGELIVTGRSQDGLWARVTYKGKTLYVQSDCLEIYQSTDNPGGGVIPA